MVPAEDVAAALEALVSATDRGALASAVAAAEALGMKADPGSEELCAAKVRLAQLV